MINKMTEAIAISLNAEFGDNYTIIKETSRQDLKEPCFFISCLNPTMKQFLGKRYFRENQFCIQYFPATVNMNEECHAVAERLFDCLEYITESGDLMRGTAMNYEIADGILNFFVNYNSYMYKQQVNTPMETVEISNNVKE